MKRSHVALGLAAVVSLAAALRGWGLGRRVLWFDEAFTWRLAGFAWPELLERSARDNNPPLYYLLLNVWMACFGDSTLAMRIPSVLAGALSCVGVYLFVDEAYRPRASIERGRRQWLALFAAALVAVAALQIRWGWEARMYAFGAALSAFSSWLLLRALHAPLTAKAAAAPGLEVGGRRQAGKPDPRVAWRPWLLYAVAALAFAYTHTYSLFSLAAQGVFAAGYVLAGARWRPKTLVANRRFHLALVGFTIVAAGWLPWLSVLLRQMRQVQTAYWTDPLTRWSIPELCHLVLVGPVGQRRDAAIVAAVCALVLLALVWRPHEGDWFLLVSSTVPLALAVAVSAGGRNILSVACFTFSQIFLLAALARVVARIRHGPKRSLAGAVVLACFLLLYVDYAKRTGDAADSGIRAAAAHIAAARRSGESVVVCNPWYYLPLRYYLGCDVDCRLLGSPRDLVHYQGTAALGAADFVSRQEMGELSTPRVWVVGAAGGGLAGWQKESQAAFYEGYGVPGSLVVVAYRSMIASPAAAMSDKTQAAASSSSGRWSAGR